MSLCLGGPGPRTSSPPQRGTSRQAGEGRRGQGNFSPTRSWFRSQWREAFLCSPPPSFHAPSSCCPHESTPRTLPHPPTPTHAHPLQEKTSPAQRSTFSLRSRRQGQLGRPGVCKVGVSPGHHSPACDAGTGAAQAGDRAGRRGQGVKGEWVHTQDERVHGQTGDTDAPLTTWTSRRYKQVSRRCRLRSVNPPDFPGLRLRTTALCCPPVVQSATARKRSHTCSVSKATLSPRQEPLPRRSQVSVQSDVRGHCRERGDTDFELDRESPAPLLWTAAPLVDGKRSGGQRGDRSGRCAGAASAGRQACRVETGAPREPPGAVSHRVPYSLAFCKQALLTVRK